MHFFETQRQIATPAKQNNMPLRLILIILLSFIPAITISDDYWDDEETEKNTIHPILSINDYLKDNNTNKNHNNCHIVKSNNNIELSINAKI